MGQFIKCVTVTLSVFLVLQIPSYLTPPLCHLISLSLPLTIDPQQYIFALLSISHTPEGHEGAKSVPLKCGALRRQRSVQPRHSPGSEGKTFLSCSMTSWSCSTVSCSCSKSSPDTHTHRKCYTSTNGHVQNEKDARFHIQHPCTCGVKPWLHDAHLLLLCQ